MNAAVLPRRRGRKRRKESRRKRGRRGERKGRRKRGVCAGGRGRFNRWTFSQYHCKYGVCERVRLQGANLSAQGPSNRNSPTVNQGPSNRNSPTVNQGPSNRNSPTVNQGPSNRNSPTVNQGPKTVPRLIRVLAIETVPRLIRVLAIEIYFLQAIGSTLTSSAFVFFLPLSLTVSFSLFELNQQVAWMSACLLLGQLI
uniref:Uncharacterized protein n=1 Tax=Oncorhynchus kisutch TaxID=8019 RepID=A0A8C7CCE1_ONCKI